MASCLDKRRGLTFFERLKDGGWMLSYNEGGHVWKGVFSASADAKGIDFIYIVTPFIWNLRIVWKRGKKISVERCS